MNRAVGPHFTISNPSKPFILKGGVADVVQQARSRQISVMSVLKDPATRIQVRPVMVSAGVLIRTKAAVQLSPFEQALIGSVDRQDLAAFHTLLDSGEGRTFVAQSRARTLNLAAWIGDEHWVSALLKSDAPDGSGFCGMNSAMWAAANGWSKISRQIVESRNLPRVNELGWSCTDLAKQNLHHHAASEMVAWGWDAPGIHVVEIFENG